MEKVSLTKALKGRADVPSLSTTARWIKRGWINANGGGAVGTPYRIDDESLWQIRVLFLISPYLNAKVMCQFARIIQDRHNDKDYTGWLGVLENGEVVNLPPETMPTADIKVGGIHVKLVFNLNKVPFDPNAESPFS